MDMDKISTDIAELRGAVDALAKNTDGLLKEHVETAKAAIAEEIRAEQKAAQDALRQELAENMTEGMKREQKDSGASFSDFLLYQAAQKGLSQFTLPGNQEISSEYVKGAIERVKTVYGTPVSTSTGSGLVPTQYVQEIIPYIRQNSVLRQLIPSIPMEFETISIPKVTTGSTWYWQVTEASSEKTSSTQVISASTMTAKTLAAIVPVSNQLLMSSDPSAQAVLLADFARGAAEAEDNGLLNGTGSSTTAGTITGFLQASGLNAVNAATGFSYDTLIQARKEIAKDLKTSSLNLSLITNADGMALLMGLKDNNGQYIWREPVVNGSLAQVPFVGPVYSDENIASTTTTTMLLGDFSYALIGDKEQMSVLANPYLSGCFEYNCTAFRAERRLAFLIKQAVAFCKITNVAV